MRTIRDGNDPSGHRLGRSEGSGRAVPAPAARGAPPAPLGGRGGRVPRRMRALTIAETRALLEVSAALDVSPRLLAAEIEFESRWNPLAKNPRSSARGG